MTNRSKKNKKADYLVGTELKNAWRVAACRGFFKGVLHEVQRWWWRKPNMLSIMMMTTSLKSTMQNIKIIQFFQLIVI